MDKLNELISLCSAGFELLVNNHKNFYETVEQNIDESEREDIDDGVFGEMVERDTIIRIEVYPRTPITFYVIYHYDIDKALDEALDVVKQHLAPSPTLETPQNAGGNAGEGVGER